MCFKERERESEKQGLTSEIKCPCHNLIIKIVRRRSVWLRETSLWTSIIKSSEALFVAQFALLSLCTSKLVWLHRAYTYQQSNPGSGIMINSVVQFSARFCDATVTFVTVHYTSLITCCVVANILYVVLLQRICNMFLFTFHSCMCMMQQGEARYQLEH